MDLNKPIHYLRILGVIMLIMGILLLISYPLFKEYFLPFAEEHLSPDHKIEAITIQTIAFRYPFAVLASLLSGFIFWKYADQILRIPPVTNFFYTIQVDVLNSPNPLKIFILSSSAGILLYGTFFFTQGLGIGVYEEDGILEILTAFTLLVSVFFLGKSTIIMKRYDKNISIYYLIICLFILLITLEEISWGQRVFHWRTPPLFQYNFQDEINLHNFINPILADLENLFSILLLLTVINHGWIRKNKSPFDHFVLPSPSTIGIVFLTAVAWQNELIEELFAAFTLFYSWRIYKLSQFAKSDNRISELLTGSESQAGNLTEHIHQQ
ncbi:MAG: hypothetical protein ISR58_21765 [Anaerolineales bacterium]|nr:hypothetical protein [Anaerolineales bacterium]